VRSFARRLAFIGRIAVFRSALDDLNTLGRCPVGLCFPEEVSCRLDLNSFLVASSWPVGVTFSFAGLRAFALIDRYGCLPVPVRVYDRTKDEITLSEVERIRL
jgi:hypothetical protein